MPDQPLFLGTGKSFIGALIAKALHDFTEQKILVVCYTNHALDDILTSLLDVGIPGTSMVRLGGKSTPRTEPLTLQNQNSNFRRDKSAWSVIDSFKTIAEQHLQRLCNHFQSFKAGTINYKNIISHLEFEEPVFYEAFRVPRATDGSIRVGKKGRGVDDYYLLDRWFMGQDAGIYKAEKHIQDAAEIWTMPPQSRRSQRTKWEISIIREQVDQIYAEAKEYNRCQDKLARQWAEKETSILGSKRIIGCTTTAAAKYTENIQAASPDVLIVEEAGEILESHVLAALGSKTAQLIMIGDHK